MRQIPKRLGFPLLAIFAFLLAGTARADDDFMPSIQVTGEGVVTAAPDMAVVRLTVNREAATAQEALAANNEAMGDVIKALDKLKVDEKDMQTAGFNMQPIYSYPKTAGGGRDKPVLEAYRVRNTLSVRVRDLDDAGAVVGTGEIESDRLDRPDRWGAGACGDGAGSPWRESSRRSRPLRRTSAGKRCPRPRTS